ILLENNKWTPIEAEIPTAIIIDLDVIKNSPYNLTAAGAGDAISNIASILDWKLAAKKTKESYDPLIADLALISAKAVSEYAVEIRKQSYEGLDALAWALIWSGMSVNISRNPRVYSGSEHNLVHALDALGTKALHGEQAALGTAITVFLHKGNWKNIMELMNKLGLPTSAKSIGIPEETLIKALVQAKDIRDRYTILNEVKLDEKETKNILKKMGII
ncbi:MAG: iron-containing alcohol dehydrogenase, partial [Candidatus Aenigmatarchaeota archaeon]